MSAAQYNIVIEQGASFDLPLSFTQTVSGSVVPLDFTGYTAKAEVRKTHDSPKVIASLNISGSLDIQGQFTLYLTPTETAALPVMQGVWDLILYTGQTTRRWLKGSAIVEPRVTRQ